MKVLAFDTSQLQAALSFFEMPEDGSSIAEIRSGAGDTSVAHSQGLLTLVDNVVGKDLSTVDFLAVGVGPGSFTGIRIGCATAQSLAHVLGKPVLGFSSLQALSLSAAGEIPTAAVVNAYQGLVFLGATENGKWRDHALEPEAVLDPKSFVHGQKRIVGKGAATYAKIFGELSQRDAITLDASLEVQPLGLRRVVQKLWQEGLRPMGPDLLRANYLRASQAEIKWDQTVGLSVAKS